MEHMFQKQNNLDLEIVLALLRGESHLRALSKSTKSSPASVKRSVDRLIADNAIDARRVGRNRVFSLKRTIEAKEYVLAAEHYKALKCLKRYPYLAPLVEKVLASSKGVAIVFGSHANFTAKTDSDIDVYCEKPPKRADGRMSIKSGGFDLNSPLIKEIALNHVILRGVEEFYERTGLFKESR
jgi:predicted nucleotidyltransferase